MQARAREDYEAYKPIAAKQMDREVSSRKQLSVLCGVIMDIHPDAQHAILVDLLPTIEKVDMKVVPFPLKTEVENIMSSTFIRI